MGFNFTTLGRCGVAWRGVVGCFTKGLLLRWLYIWNSLNPHNVTLDTLPKGVLPI